jgi:hypothetical protein
MECDRVRADRLLNKFQRPNISIELEAGFEISDDPANIEWILGPSQRCGGFVSAEGKGTMSSSFHVLSKYGSVGP